MIERKILLCTITAIVLLLLITVIIISGAVDQYIISAFKWISIAGLLFLVFKNSKFK